LKSRSWLTVGSLALIALLLAGCKTVSSESPSEDFKKWQGAWRLVRCSYDGKPQTADMEWIVTGSQYTIRLNGRLQEDPNTFKLGPIRKHIDVIHHETPPGTYGGRAKGIYEVSSNALTVCYDLTGEGYPKSFETSPGSRLVVYEFRRK
jgi:uncharacterized protein (TIGR03067 family)